MLQLHAPWDLNLEPKLSASVGTSEATSYYVHPDAWLLQESNDWKEQFLKQGFVTTATGAHQHHKHFASHVR